MNMKSFIQFFLEIPTACAQPTYKDCGSMKIDCPYCACVQCTYVHVQVMERSTTVSEQVSITSFHLVGTHFGRILFTYVDGQIHCTVVIDLV